MDYVFLSGHGERKKDRGRYCTCRSRVVTRKKKGRNVNDPLRSEGLISPLEGERRPDPRFFLSAPTQCRKKGRK